MTRDVHQQVREWIVLSGTEALSDSQQSQLQAHLRECDLCHQYAEGTAQVIRALRSVPLTAGPSLVRTTQARVRARAQQLQQQRERLWVVVMAGAGVALSATVTTPVIWGIFSWLGNWAGVSGPVWQTGFTAFLVAPALLISILLLARGTHLTDQAGRWHE